MKLRSILVAIGLAALMLGAEYAVRAQTTKADILLDFEVTKNGEVIGKPVLRMTDGGAALLALKDGTHIKVTGKTIVH